jgi:hypothetical protein
MKMRLFLYPLFLCSLVAACTTESKWINHTARIINVGPTDATVKRIIGGSVTITSDCSFAVRNMTLIPSGNAAYWWGIPVDNNTEPFPRVVTAALGSYNGQNVIFNLDSQYSFGDIAIMEIRSEGDNQAYGAWSLSGDVENYYDIHGNVDLGLDDWENWISSAHPILRRGWGSFIILYSGICMFMMM